MSENLDRKTIDGFGDEWDSYDQTDMASDEHDQLFSAYFSIFPFVDVPKNAEGFDLGCGSGRWAALVAPRVGILHCIDPSDKALAVARRRLADEPGARFHLATSQQIPLADASQDFGYSLGVLHHIPDTRAALQDCTRKLKPGAPFLVYLYYRFDNRPAWFRAVWRASDIVRRGVSRLPFAARKTVTSVMAAIVYWPLARIAGLAERLGMNVAALPLSFYRNTSFYTMRTDALDRFGTALEHRFTRPEIEAMMSEAGLGDIRFHDGEPFWIACGRKRL
ncbi:class I SAM-dependent methyltransferase [Sphingomonas sp. M1A8_2b]